MSLYSTLGVAQDASPAAIKAAFRSLAQKNHPDKGGDHATMQAIQAAYDVLSDVDRRARYDETGETTEGPTTRDLAITQLADMTDNLFQFLTQSNKSVEWVDILLQMRGKLNETLTKGANIQHAVTKAITMRTKALKRLSWKEAGATDIMQMILDGQISNLHQQMVKNEQALDVTRMALDLLSDYTYEVDSPPMSEIFGIHPGMLGVVV